MAHQSARRAFLAGLAASVGGFVACGDQAIGQDRATVPSFSIRTETGKQVRIEDYRGKVLLLNFWATWCPHCRRQVAAMNKLKQSFAAKDIEILALSVDKEGWTKVAPYMEENKLTLTVGLADATIQQKYGITGGIPLTYIIDRKGYAVKDFRGAIDEETLVRLADVIHEKL